MAEASRIGVSPGWVVLDARGVPIADVTAFLGHIRDIERSPNTIKAYAYDLAHLFSFLETTKATWTSIDNETLGRFIRSMRSADDGLRSARNPEGKRAKRTVNRCLSAVSSFAAFLADSTEDPVYAKLLRSARRSIDSRSEYPREVVSVGPRLAREANEIRLLTDIEVGSILDQCDHLRDRFLFSLLNETGMRIGQALLLRHSDVRVQKSSIVVRRHSYDAESGERNKSVRSAVVPVPASLIRLYASYMHHEYKVLDSDYVFVNLWGGDVGAPLAYGTVIKLVKRLQGLSGTYEWGPHSFRHTYVTRLLRAGVSPKTVSYLVTHASVLTTIEIYGHLNSEDIRSELESSGVWN